MKEPWEMSQKEFVDSHPKRVTINVRGKVKAPEGETSFYGRASLGSKLDSYMIDDTPTNREWMKRIKCTVARSQGPQRDYKYQHEQAVKQAIAENKPVPETVKMDYLQLL